MRREQFDEPLVHGAEPERLDQVVFDPCPLRSQDGVVVEVRGEHDERHVAEAAVGTHRPKQVEAAHRRHEEVREHKAEFAAAQEVQGAPTVRRIEMEKGGPA